MTADICTAAFKSWHSEWWNNEQNPIDKSNAQAAFFAGWDAKKIPSREQIALTVAQFFGSDDTPEDVADAILKLFNK